MSESGRPRLSNETIGALLGLLCAVSTASFVMCFREASQLAPRTSVVAVMLLAAAILNSALTASRLQATPRPNAEWLRTALVLSVLTVVGNLALAVALPLLGAGVGSTLMQTQVLFVAVLAWFFLGEAIGASLALGALMAAGGFAFYALPGAGTAGLSAYGLALGLVTALSFSAMIVWTRKVIAGLDPVSLNAGRLWIAVLGMMLWPGVLHHAVQMPTRAWAFAGLAALGGPLVGRLAIMYSLRYISAAKTKLWGMLAPVFAFFFVYLIYGVAPSPRELVGALLIVGCVLLPTLGTLRARRGQSRRG